MGCGLSTKDDAAPATPLSPSSHSNRVQRKATTERQRAYIGDVHSITSAEYTLFGELEARTDSPAADASEPSVAAFALRQRAVAMRGKLKNGVTDDVNQYDASAEKPEFKQRDKKRVVEWLNQVAAATPRGPEAIPDSFYLPLNYGVESSSVSSGQTGRVAEDTSSGAGVELDVSSQRAKDTSTASDLWSNKAKFRVSDMPPASKHQSDSLKISIASVVKE